MRSRLSATRGTLIALCMASSAPAQEARRPPITGIAYVRIYARDPAASQRFYTQEVLLPQAQCPMRACARYQVGEDQYVEVVKANRQADGLQVIGFRTTDAEGLRRYLAAHHVKVPARVEQQDDGRAEFAITDAAGHRVAFIEAKATSDQRGAISHRLIHVGFIVKDRGSLDPLYKDILGFRPYWHGGMKPERTDWVSLQVPDGTDWLEYMLNVPPDASPHLIGVMNHFSLGVEDMDATDVALQKTGWKPHGEEHKQMGLDGKYQLNLFDPDEVRVEFMTFTPSQRPCCSDFTGPHPRPD
ncbi:MAG TPA: VOC family protein [Gemmatimonadales bacterium]|nr:VOC family protein [Gemmatimonadales bacterium]